MMTKVKILRLSKRKNIYTRMLIIPRSEKMKDLWKKHITLDSWLKNEFSAMFYYRITYYYLA